MSHTLAQNADEFSEIDKFSSTDPTTAKLAVGALIGAGMFVVCVVAGGVMFMMPFVPPNWPLTRAGFVGEQSEGELLDVPINSIKEILFVTYGLFTGYCVVCTVAEFGYMTRLVF